MDQPAASTRPSVVAPPSDALEHELGVLVRRSRAWSARIAKEVHPDLEPGAYSILVRLSETGGERLTDMAAAFRVGKPTVSRQVTVLERLHLLSRTPDPTDARSHLLRLTPEGATRLGAARAARHDRFRDLMSTWPAQDVATLAGLLARFNELTGAAEPIE